MMTTESKVSSRLLRLRALATWTLVASLAACGGGGGGSDPVANPPPAPAPTPGPAPAPAPTSDEDGDGLTFAEETALGTSPTNPDSDGDGLSDGAEAGLSKNPLVSDNTEADPALPRRGTLLSEAGTSPGVVLAADGFSATFNAVLNQACVDRTGIFADPIYSAPSGDAERCRKRAVRANVGIEPGEFRYFETHRTGPRENMGQGIITATAQIDPYCCFVESNDTVNFPYNGTPPSMTINSVGGVFVRLNFLGGSFNPAFDLAATTYYGFAVDYRGADPVVYLVVSDASGAMTVSDAIPVANFGGGPAMPMLHGHPQAEPRQPLEMNLGLKQFHYDLAAVRTAMTARNAPDMSQFVPGVGVHRWAIPSP